MGIASADVEKARQDAVIGKVRGSISQIDVNVPAEAARLDTLQETVAAARATLSERQQAVAVHEANDRLKQVLDEIVCPSVIR